MLQSHFTKQVERFDKITWEALKSDHNDLRRQQIIYREFLKSQQETIQVLREWAESKKKNFYETEESIGYNSALDDLLNFIGSEK